MSKTTQIPLSVEVRDCIKRLGIKGETYDTILRRLLEQAGVNIDG